MVFLANLDILDTGYLSKSARGTQLSAPNRANSGSQIKLKSVSLDITSSGNIDKSVPPAKYTASQHATISVNPTELSISFIIGKYSDTNNTYGINDSAMIPELLRLPHTLGFKALFYPVDNAASGDILNRNTQLIYRAGTADTTEAQGDINLTLWTGAATASSKDLTDVNYVAVRFDSCKITQTTGSNMNATLSGVITS